MAEVFAPVHRGCPGCGAEVLTAGRECPQCGAQMVARRPRLLTGRRERAALVACAVLVAGAALAGMLTLGPRIERGRRQAASVAAEQAARSREVIVAFERREQVPRRALIGPGPLREAVGTLVLADARARVRSGAIDSAVLSVQCSLVTRGSARVVGFRCLAVTGVVRRGAGDVRSAAGVIGVPFWARADTVSRRVVWCRVTPRPGEMAIAAAPPPVALDRRCDLTRPAPEAL